MSATEPTQIVAEIARPRSLQLRSDFRRSAQGREIVIVLGMHRSGTSLLANILHLLGVDMMDVPPHASIKNETGFWERPDIVAIHDEILAALGVPVNSPAHAVPFAAGWWRSVEIRPLKEKLRDVVAGHLAHVRRPWGFKDPRTCRLLPLWGEILEELDVSPRFVWAMRHPAESARSMSEKNPHRRPIPVSQSEVMWLAYNYDILRYAGRHWPLVVPYEAWFEDPLGLAKEIAQELDLVWQGSDHELESALGELINPEQRHHKAGAARVKSALGLSDDIYRSILSLRRGQEATVSESAAVSLHSLLGAVQPFALEARDARVLAEENKTIAAGLEDAKAQLAHLQARSEKQRDNEAIMVARVETLTRKLNEARSERDGLAKDADTLREQVAHARAAAEGLQADLEASRAEQQRLAGLHDAAQAERDSHREQLGLMSASHQSLQASLTSATQKLDSLRSRIAEAVEAREDAERKLAEAVTEAAAVRAKAEQDIHALNQKLDGFRHKLANVTALREQSEASLLETARERDQLQADIAALSGERDQLRNELSALSAERDQVRRDFASARVESDQLRAELAALSGERDQLRTDLSSAVTERDALAARMAETESEWARQAEELASLHGEHATKAEAHSELAAECERLRAELEAASGLQRKTAEASKAEADRLKSDLLALKNALRNERERVAELAAQTGRRVSS